MTDISQLALIPAAGRFEPRQQLSAWENAKARFLEGLDPAERTLFDEATVENLFYSSSVAERQDSKDSKVRVGFEKIRPLVAAIEDYGKALDVYAQIAPLYLAPIWGSIRVIISIASIHSKFYSRMVEVLGQIGELLPRFHDYEKLFDASEHPRFAETLSKAYLDIIELCTDFKKMIREQKISRIKRVFQPLSASTSLQLEDAIVKFKDHRELVEKEAELCHMIEEKKSRELVIMNKKEEEMRLRVYRQKDLIAQLSNLDHKYKHRRMQRLRHPGTGTWAMPIFQEWLASDNNEILCCSGIRAGSGKSVLTSTLVDTAQVSYHGSSKSILYFYCDHADEGTLEPSEIFRNLAQQLLSMLSPIPESILTSLDELLRRGKSVDHEDIMNLLEESIKKFSSLIIFIDGLDELLEASRIPVVKRLWALLQNSVTTTLKIYVSGREDSTRLTNPPKAKISKIKMDQDSIREDICNFVTSEVHCLIENGDLLIGEQSLREEIITTLIDGSRGMFLWVKFQLVDLCASDSDHAIRTTLRMLPKDLSETYDRFLQRAYGNENQRRELLKRMINWLLCARRPLSVDEIREAIAFTINDDHFDTAKLPNDLHRLVRASENLIIIDEATQNVQLAHYTVQQYLLQAQETTSRSFFCNTVEDANEKIGSICLAYLSFSDFEQQITQYRDTGITSNIATMEKVITTQNLIPSKAVETAAIKYLKGVRKPHQGINEIDFARHVKHPRTAPEDPLQQNKYTLLPYIRENWLHHTKYLRYFEPESGYRGAKVDLSLPKNILPQHIFHSLIFNKTFPFEIWPYNPIVFSRSEYLYSVQFSLALHLDHLPLATELFDWRKRVRNSESREISIHWQHIARWTESFWDDQPTGLHHVTPDIKRQLNRNFRSESPTKENWEGWIYLRVIDAVHGGDLNPLQLLLQAWSSKTIYAAKYPLPSLHAFFGHLLLEGVLHSRQSFVQAICGQLRYRRAPIYPFPTEEIFIRTTHDGLDCNAFEVACLLGSEAMINSISNLVAREIKFIDPLTRYHDSLFATDKLSDAIRERNYPRINALIHACLSPECSPEVNIRWAFYEYDVIRHQEDRNVIQYCVHTKRNESILPPDISNDALARSDIAYHKHWTFELENLSPRYSIDLILISGYKSSDNYMQYLLAEAIQGDYPNPETPLQVKRVERLVKAGAHIIGATSFYSISYYRQLTYKNLQFPFTYIHKLSPVYHAILNNRPKIVELLIKAGALDSEETFYSYSPLHYAILGHSPAMFSLLVDYGYTSLGSHNAIQDLTVFTVRNCRSNKVVQDALIALIRENNLLSSVFSQGEF